MAKGKSNDGPDGNLLGVAEAVVKEKSIGTEKLQTILRGDKLEAVDKNRADEER